MVRHPVARGFPDRIAGIASNLFVDNPGVLDDYVLVTGMYNSVPEADQNGQVSG